MLLVVYLEHLCYLGSRPHERRGRWVNQRQHREEVAGMSVADALRMMNAGLDYLNGPGADELDAAACGSVLRSLAAVQAKFTAAHALVLARFDAADAHDCDGYGNSAAWLMAMTDMTRRTPGSRCGRCGCCATTPRWLPPWPPRTSPSPGRWRSPSGRRSSPRSCARRPSRSWWRLRPRAPPGMTCGSSPRWRSRNGAPPGPTPMMTGSTTGTCRSGPRSAAPA